MWISLTDIQIPLKLYNQMDTHVVCLCSEYAMMPDWRHFSRQMYTLSSTRNESWLDKIHGHVPCTWEAPKNELVYKSSCFIQFFHNFYSHPRCVIHQIDQHHRQPGVQLHNHTEPIYGSILLWVWTRPLQCATCAKSHWSTTTPPHPVWGTISEGSTDPST